MPGLLPRRDRLRSIGIPVRYVRDICGRCRRLAGRVRSAPTSPTLGVAVYCGPQVGWLDIDPTNDCLCGTDHIPIAFGRDYNDVVPLRGVFVVGGEHQFKVSVDVSPIDDGENGEAAEHN